MQVIETEHAHRVDVRLAERDPFTRSSVRADDEATARDAGSFREHVPFDDAGAGCIEIELGGLTGSNVDEASDVAVAETFLFAPIVEELDPIVTGREVVDSEAPVSIRSHFAANPGSIDRDAD